MRCALMQKDLNWKYTSSQSATLRAKKNFPFISFQKLLGLHLFLSRSHLIRPTPLLSEIRRALAIEGGPSIVNGVFNPFLSKRNRRLSLLDSRSERKKQNPNRLSPDTGDGLSTMETTQVFGGTGDGTGPEGG
ncbi:hypothetical protein ES332_A10G121200v1 [Gossypium tomentosum]|uniref:Uncharacterized protein n=1 Tax=Gossypium tomentosum TaxID=34277 RepID=A0A5D2NS49_GOSTO|nr:hypothetical protein ES332_A10G121200v1 [Gossypium tomentosum]